jgi:cytochrome c5
MSTNTNETAQGIVAMIAIVLVAGLAWAFIIAMAYGGYGESQLSSAMKTSDTIEDRIRPVVTLADIRSDAKPVEKMAAPVAAAKSAADLYAGGCSACHAVGVAGAPKLGDKAAWQPRFANGIDALLTSVVNGKGAMPPKGGTAYSEAEIKQVIEYMLSETGLIAAAKTQAVAPEKTSSVATHEQTKTPAVNSTVEQAVSDKAVFKDETVQPNLQAGMTGYKGACFACHDTGAAGAPRINDRMAWAHRLPAGLDNLTASAIRGKGAMPPKGGVAYLSEVDVKNIVAFMMSTVQ